jgi:intracellular septation protein A
VVFWRRFTVALAVLFLLLSALNLVALLALPVAQWVQLKRFVPALALLVFSVGATLVLAGKADRPATGRGAHAA